MLSMFSWLNKLVFREQKRWLLIFPAAFIYIITASPLSFFDEVYELAFTQTSLKNRIFGVIFYISTSFTCTISILLFCYDRGKINLLIFSLLFFCGVLDFAYTEVVGHHFNLSEYIFFLNEFRQTGNAIIEYLPATLKSILYLLPIYAILVLSKKFLVIRLRYRVIKYLLFGGAVLCVAISMQFSHGKRDNYVTAPRALGVALYAAKNSNYLGTNLPYSARILGQNIQIEKKTTKHIILVIDESITANYLSINGYPLATTPFLSDNTDKYINLGVSTSTGNASNTSNYMLRTGLTPKNCSDSPLDTFSWPTLFTYAKRAGMRTIMLDSQQGASSLQNFMSNYDVADIDLFINLPRKDGVLYAMDFEAVDKVQEILDASDEPCFVVLVKMGIHFPYYLRYPREEAVFLPDYEKNSAVVDVVRYQGTEEGAQRHLNTYLNSIRYCVDKYLEHMIKTLNLDNTLVVYTSDHGQSINSQRTSGTHNTWPEVVAAQFSVPIILLGDDFKTLFSTSTSPGGYSSFQIFPSILMLMGYPESLAASYGTTFWSGPGEQKSWVGPLFYPGGMFQNIDIDNAEIAFPGEEFARPWGSLRDR